MKSCLIILLVSGDKIMCVFSSTVHDSPVAVHSFMCRHMDVCRVPLDAIVVRPLIFGICKIYPTDVCQMFF